MCICLKNCDLMCGKCRRNVVAMALVPPANPAAVINVPAGQNLQQVLNDHDHAKRSTDIPLFHGQPAWDTIAARLLIVRVNDAGEIASWNNNRKLLEFKMCLRDKAVGWFEGLTEDGVETNNWDTVKTEFLETYEPKYSAKTTCANFTDLNQKAEESIVRDHQLLEKLGKVHTIMLIQLQEIMNTYDFDIIYKKG
jgi:hypothetical protein